MKAEERKRAAAAQRGVLNKTSKFRGVTKVKGKKARPWQASKDNVHRERAEASSSWQGHGGEGVGPAGGARSCSGSTAPSSATTASNMVVVVVAGLVLLALGPQKICGLPVPVPVGSKWSVSGRKAPIPGNGGGVPRNLHLVGPTPGPPPRPSATWTPPGRSFQGLPSATLYSLWRPRRSFRARGRRFGWRIIIPSGPSIRGIVRSGRTPPRARGQPHSFGKGSRLAATAPTENASRCQVFSPGTGGSRQPSPPLPPPPPRGRVPPPGPGSVGTGPVEPPPPPPAPAPGRGRQRRAGRRAGRPGAPWCGS